MKKLILIAVVAALSACSQDTEEAADAGAGETPEAGVAVAAEQDPAGSYNVKRYNGGTSTIVIDPAGTYTDTGPNGPIEAGTFALKGGNYCFDPEGDDPERCWTVGQPGADGSFTASDPDGHVVTLTRETAETASPES